MLANAADFCLEHDGIVSAGTAPARDQLGRFLGNLPGFDDDEDCTDCTGSVFALVAETITTDETDDEVAEGSVVEDIELTPEEREEVRRLAAIFDEWNYEYTSECLTTLRKLDGLAWVCRRYGDVTYIEAPSDDEEPQIPSQSGPRYDDYVKVLSWDAYKYNKKQESHGQHGRCKYRWNQKGRTEAGTIRKVQKTFRAVDISRLQAES